MTSIRVPIPLVPANGGAPSAAVDAVLAEVSRMLDRLVDDPSFADAIDLRSLPLSDAERGALRERLGDGEVRAALRWAGDTRVDETAFAGVWWLRAGDDASRSRVEQIVVARVPALLCAHVDDIADAGGRLAASLAGTAASPDRDAATR